MPKKRKTRQEKIILQLKRKLAQQKLQTGSAEPEIKTRQEAISLAEPGKAPKPPKEEKADKSIFFYDPSLARKDLFKTLFLTLLILAFEFVLYWKLG